jgi:hypothetical protein
MSTFNPSTIPGISLWLDASDTNNTTVNNGIVTQLLDKSGNNYKVNIIGSPPFATNSITFDGSGTSYFHLQDGSIPYGDSAFSMYFVISMADNANRGLLSAGNANSPNIPLQIRNTGSQSMYISAGNVADTFPKMLIPSYNNNFIYSTVYSKNTSTTGFINGTPGAYVVSTNTRSQTNSPNYLGSWGPGNLRLKGSISEVLIFGNAHSVALRQQIEGYLAWKWALNGSLNAKHPYKTLAPIATLKGSLGSGVIYSPSTVTKAGPPLIPQQILVAGGYTTNTGNVSIGYSYDGISWARSNITALTKTTFKIAYNGTMYIAANGYNFNESCQLIYSYDGINWISNPTSTNSFTNVSDIAWSGTSWMLTSRGGSSTSNFSSDGFNWVNSPTDLDNSAYNVKWINNRWVILGSGRGTSKILTSTNGINWSGVRDIPGNLVFNGTTTATTTFIEFNGNVILIGSYGINNFVPLQYSTDNLVTLTTSATASAIFTGGMYAAAWNGLLWVGVGGGTASIATSTNGITWTAVANSLSIFTTGSSVAWNGVRWVVGGLGSYSTAYSTGGIEWTGSNNLSFANTLSLCSRTLLPNIQLGATPPITGTFPESLLPLCELWLDAADVFATGSQPTYNTQITTWLDKSGNGRNAISYNSNPTFLVNPNILNRMPVVNTAAGTMYIPYKEFPVSGYTIMAVQYSRPVNGDWGRLLVNVTNDTLYYGVTAYNNGGIAPIAMTNQTGFYLPNTPLVESANKWLLTSYTSTPTVGTPYVSGTALNTNAGTGNIAFNDLIISSNGTGSQYFNGYVAEILIFSTVLTRTQRQLAEGYLSWKWGLVDKLPAAHPHKLSYVSDVPYYVGDFSPVNLNALVTWFDGSDPLNTGKAPPNNSTVSTWYDKSGNGLNINQNGALPIYNRSLIAGVPGLDFTSGGGLYVPTVQKSSNITLFWVGIIKSTVTNNGILFGHFSSENTDAVLRMDGSTPNVGWRTNSVNTTVPITYDSPVIFSCTMENGSNMFIQKTDLSGTITASSTQTSTIVTGQNGNINIGSASPGIQLLNSYIGEVLYYHALLPLSQRQLIEGYLAWKMNLNSYLPESNPYSKINPNGAPVNTPPICFLKGSIVETDQAVVEIQNIDPNVHTIGGKKIIALTKTPGDKMSLVLIRRNLIARGSPYVDTPITIAHKILYNNKLISAIFIPGATPYKFTNQLLYNVLLETHETMRVNGMVVETLSHEHPTAKKYLDKFKE